jgi:hypothetical protein
MGPTHVLLFLGMAVLVDTSSPYRLAAQVVKRCVDSRLFGEKANGPHVCFF